MKRVFILICLSFVFMSFVAAQDVAYIYRNENNIDNNIIDVFSDLGYDTITYQEEDMPSDLSGYSFIFVGDETFREDIPVGEYPSVVANRRHGTDWQLVDNDGLSTLQANRPLEVDYFGQVIDVYTNGFVSSIGIPYYYMKDNNKASGFIAIAKTPSSYGPAHQGDVVSYVPAGGLLYESIAAEPICFYGIIESEHWTDEAEEIFKECILKVALVCLSEDDCDGDGILNDDDNCPNHPNPDQEDTDGDGKGNVCDSDDDDDGIIDTEDNCLLIHNPNQIDTDEDGIGNKCDDDDDDDGIIDIDDNCPLMPNPDQEDTDLDGIGDVCELIQCSDGIDNDGDMLVDLDDPGCSEPGDHDESDGTSECQDGIDNDQDGLTDMEDPGCDDKTDYDESDGTSECQDGIDNDGDGNVDMDDEGCESSQDNDESSDYWNDLFAPLLEVYSPEQQIYDSASIPISYFVLDSNLDTCWYAFAGNDDVMLDNCENITIILENGEYELTIYVSDTADNINSSTIGFIVSYFAIENISTDLEDKTLDVGTEKDVIVGFDSTIYPLNITFDLFSTGALIDTSETVEVLYKSASPTIYTISSGLPGGDYTLEINAINILKQIVASFVETFTIEDPNPIPAPAPSIPVSPGGSPGGGTIRHSCEPEWECTDWSSCINTYQKRTCTDRNSCGNQEPETRKKCELRQGSIEKDVGGLASGNLSLKPALLSGSLDSDMDSTEPAAEKVQDAITGFVGYNITSDCELFGRDYGRFFGMCWNFYMFVYFILLMMFVYFLWRAWNPKKVKKAEKNVRRFNFAGLFILVLAVPFVGFLPGIIVPWNWVLGIAAELCAIAYVFYVDT